MNQLKRITVLISQNITIIVFAVGVSFSWRCTWQSEASR